MKTNRRTVLKGAGIGAGMATMASGSTLAQHQQALADQGGSKGGADPSGPLVTVPALQQWTSQPGTLQMGAMVWVVPADRGLQGVADTMASDLADLGLKATSSWNDANTRGAVVLRLGQVGRGDEGYRLVVDADRITITGPTPRAVFNGTRTVLQWLHQTHQIPRGTAVDWPAKPLRGLLFDQTPRHLSVQAWTDLFKRMSWFKFNDTNMYVDGVGTTIDEAREIDKIAQRYFIKIVPQINMPGHLHVMLPSHPEYQLVNKDGTKNQVALDLTNPRAVELALGLLPPWLDAFSGDEWHLGSDEFPGWPGTGADHPQLDAYAKQRFGAQATFADLFADFQNQGNALVKKHGKTMRVWNDMIRDSKVVKLDSDVTVEYWIQHDQLPGLLDANQIAARGNPVINAHVDHLYYDMSRRNLDPQQIWEGDQNLGPFDVHMFPYKVPIDQARRYQVRGARICIWLAYINTPIESDAEVLSNITAPMQAVAQVLWGSARPAKEYADFAAHADRAGAPPVRAAGDNDFVGTPAVARNTDGSLAYFAVSGGGELRTGRQSSAGTMHFTNEVVARNIQPGSVSAALDADGRIVATAWTSTNGLLVARQQSPGSDGFTTRTIARATQRPAATAQVAAVNDYDQLVAVDLSTGRQDRLASGITGAPVITAAGQVHHILARTAKGLVHASGRPGSWQVHEVSGVEGELALVSDGTSTWAVASGTAGVQVAQVGDGSTWQWRSIAKGPLLGSLAVGSDAIGGAHLAFTVRTHEGNEPGGAGSYGTLHRAEAKGQFAPIKVADQIVDGPTIGFDGAGTVHLFAHTVRRTLAVMAPKPGGHDLVHLVESQESPVRAIADGKGMITWFGATTYGDLQAGARWGGIGDWGRDFVVGAFGYIGDNLTPDAITQVVHRGSAGLRTLRPSTTESAPAPTIRGGQVTVQGSKFFTMMQSPQTIDNGFASVRVRIDTLLDQAKSENTVMVGFARDEKNYVAIWANAALNRVGFDRVYDGKLTPDTGAGTPAFVVRPGDTLAMTLAYNWMLIEIQREGVWQRVHAAVANSPDNLRRPAVRAGYHPMFALRGDQGTMAVSNFACTRAPVPVDPSDGR